MRLLVLDQFSDPGGAQQVLLDLLPAIRKRSWEALIGLPGQGEMFSRVRALGFETEKIVCGPFASGAKSLGDIGRLIAQTPRLAAQIRRLAQQIHADLVYINGPRLLPAAALAGLRCPVLFHCHSYLSPGPVRKLAGISLRRLQAGVIGSCRFVAGLWESFIDPSRIAVIYNGVKGWGTKGPRVRRGPYTIGCIGRIAPEKGQREFVTAASIIHRALPECRFQICGGPLFADSSAVRYHDEVRAEAAGLPIDFTGWVDDVYGSLSNLDLLLVPSAAHDATPRVILEAFAAGVPVIAFPSGGIPEMIDNGRTGLLANSPEEMARLAIGLLTRNPERMAAISDAADASWSTNFTAERFQRQVLSLMESWADSCRGAASDPLELKATY